MTSLWWVRNWGARSNEKSLRCPHRDLVREFVWRANRIGVSRLEKVKGHDDEAVKAGQHKAVGNKTADFRADQARMSPQHVWRRRPRFMDAILLCSGASTPLVAEVGLINQMNDAGLTEVEDIGKETHIALWEKQRGLINLRRSKLSFLTSGKVDWDASNWCFKSPKCCNGIFSYEVETSFIKWPEGQSRRSGNTGETVSWTSRHFSDLRLLWS
jgi:hypothetical protein